MRMKGGVDGIKTELGITSSIAEIGILSSGATPSEVPNVGLKENASNRSYFNNPPI